MQDAEKRLNKLAQRDSLVLKRAEAKGLQVDYAALELHIHRNFLNYGIDHRDYRPTHRLTEESIASAPTALYAANHE